MDFVHLHVHSNYTFCRGANSIDKICSIAKKRGFTHLALTDRNGIYGLVWFIETAKNCGLVPIIGACLEHKNQHCVILAKSMTGYQFLCTVISKINCSPNFDLADFLVQYRSDVFILSQDINFLKKFIYNNSDVYAELVPFKNREALLKFAKQNSFQFVATNNVYLLDESDYFTHNILRAIDLNTTLERIPPNELASRQSTLKTAEEMANFFPDCPEAITNSIKIAHSCQFDFDFHGFIFPSFTGPHGEDANTVLKSKVEDGLIWRYGKINSQIKERLEYEMDIIISKGFAPYFLVVSDIVEKAPRTCGRGSAAASLVSYALGITHVDPIRYNLFFERFLNPGRIDPPDIDVDFPWDERDDIIDFIFSKYGNQNVAMISNHNTFKARSAVREIAKVYGIPEAEIGKITKKMTGYWQPQNIWDLTQTHPVYKHTEFKEPWPEIIAYAEKIRGYPRHLSIHCGGVVLAPGGLDQYVPYQPAKKILRLSGVFDDKFKGLPKNLSSPEELKVIQWEKDQSEDMGLVKMDILGNRSLAVIRDTLRAIYKNYKIKIDYAKWDPLNDAKTQTLLQNGDTIGVFYVESPAMRLLQQKTQKGDFEHLVIHSSIIRPAANAYIDEYIRRLNGGKYESLHLLLDTILSETFGIMVYQEDVSKVVMALADFKAAEADDLRKIISKKHKLKQICDYRDKFYSGAQKKGISFDICDKVWNMIMSFSGYSFCKPHSASYALVSFKSAYLKAYYPAEFMAAVISNQGGYYSTFAYISEARRKGISVLLPDINKSERQYIGFKNQIITGFMQLKGLNSATINNILEERQRGEAYKNFQDFISRVFIDPSDIAILIKAGCFDSIENKRSRPELLWHYKFSYASKEYAKKQSTLSLFDESPIIDTPKPDQYDQNTIVKHEIETFGFLMSKHPLSLYKKKILKQNIIYAREMKRHVNKYVKMIGWFITGKITSTKDEQLMEFISFEDTTAIYETTFFPKTFSKFIHMISRERPFILEGKIESNYGAVTLSVDRVEYL